METADRPRWASFHLGDDTYISFSTAAIHRDRRFEGIHEYSDHGVGIDFLLDVDLDISSSAIYVETPEKITYSLDMAKHNYECHSNCHRSWHYFLGMVTRLAS